MNPYETRKIEREKHGKQYREMITPEMGTLRV